MEKAKSPAKVALKHFKVFALSCIIGLLLYSSGFSQVGIGSNPHPSAILDLSNSGKGFLLPRVSSGQRDSIANPAIGLVIFNTSTKSLNTYTALGWMEMQGTLIGRIASLNEQPAQHQGSLYAETAASGVYSEISYTGGNGGSFHAIIVASSGVQGLTAKLAAGSFAQGNGTLTFEITGTPLSTGIAQFAFSIGGRNTSFSRTVKANAVYPVGTVHCLPGGAAIVDVTNPVTGRTWMDRNLGASNVARWATDATSFGDLYQWGRLSDGHQCRSKTSTRTEWSTSDTPGHSFFIGINTGMQVLPGWNNTLDWRVPQNDNLWQGVEGINNPCPSGYRLPTQSEWDAEVQSWSANDTSGAFLSPLKLPAAGSKAPHFGSITTGFLAYWVSTTNGYGVGASGGIRSIGASVRCIKDNGVQPVGSISSLACPSSAVAGGLNAFQPAGDVFQAISYTGGNGGYHNGQAVASTGVTGLTASVSPGSFTMGNGALVYRISGTPKGRGTASFSLSIGGQSCTLQYFVAGNPAVIAGGLDCAGAEHLGGLYSGTAADSIRTIIRYTGGNGGTYETQTVASTGVTGLTATLSAWRLATGDSSLNFVISGTPISAGAAFFTINIGGKTCTFTRNVGPPLAVVNSLNCVSATHAGVLVDGTPAVNAASIINYSGGNGGRLSYQSVTSTGVAGLTATLNEGNINVGDGSISIQISGTPSSNGIANFAISLGGQSCILFRKVFATAQVAALNCDAVVNRGVLSSGVPASGVNFTVSYTGGNGGAHVGQTAMSTGVTGLTATLFPDSLAVGTGVLAYYISGTAGTEGTAHFALAIGGSTCTVSVTVAPAPVYASGTVHCLPGGTPVVDVTNPATGRTWMDRNLGSEPKPEFGSGYMTPGDLFQWGRAADGHQCRESAIISTLSSADAPGHGKFITNNLDWRNPENSNLWQGVNGVNNPCPSGYRIPSAAEWEAEQASWQDRDVFGALTSVLRLPIKGGYRSGTDGMPRTLITAYWTSSTQNAVSLVAWVDPFFSVKNDFRSHGFLVRCIKDYINTAINPITSIGCHNYNVDIPQLSLFKDSLADGATISIPYTGGNGSAHVGQVVQSTGVTGLTATLAPGNFTMGNGTLTYYISGRASVIGNAFFAINIGGLQCSKIISVIKGPGTVAGLDSAGTTHTGTLVRGIAAVGSGFSIPYTGGNGGTFAAQWIESTGVAGLTASIEAGTLNVGSGTLQFSINGTPATAGTARFTINIGGRTCIVIRTVTPPPGTLTGLNCVAIDSTGILQRGVAATATSTISYSGANAGTYSGQAVASSGVTGLTASLPAGVLADGSGTLTYSISGTPASAGVASFTISIGGQSCVISRTVDLPPGLLTELRCDSTITTGTLESGLVANGVSTTVHYTGGNGGFYGAQAIPSTGITGLTASLSAGQFQLGDGTLTLNITGTPSAAGIASFAINIGGQTCIIQRSVTVRNGVISDLYCNFAFTSSNITEGELADSVLLRIFYDGGNGGSYPSLAVPSTGITGLTATLDAGNFATGFDTLRFIITGTATGVGTAQFAISVGGQSCIIGVFVRPKVALVGSVQCTGTDTTGTLQEGVAASDVRHRVRYSNGNYGRYAQQTVASTGVTGLTATLPAGWLLEKDGSVIFSITGTPASTGTAFFEISIGGQSCIIQRSVQPKVGTVSGLNCSSSSSTGTLYAGVPATGVGVAVPYSGGNGGAYNRLAIPSEGVTGLTATLSASQLVTGSDSLHFFISGTPAAVGTASFTFSLGGQSCTFTRVVSPPIALVSSLNCAATVIRGIFEEAFPTSSTSFSVPFSGGQGTYLEQIITSTGVSGLTARLPTGNLNAGSGLLNYTITGTPASSGTASFDISIGGQTCTITIPVAPKPVYRSGTVHCIEGGALVHPLTSATTGRIWMDRNLGALTTSTYPEDRDAWGDLYQWGRGADGHQCRNSTVRNSLSNIDQPGHSDFILPNPALMSDWRNPQNDNLWQGVDGVNNPCPTGYRVPTLAEWQSEGASVSMSFVYNKALNLTNAGYRSYDQGTFGLFENTYGFYWTSTISSQNPGFSVSLLFAQRAPAGSVHHQPRGYGFAVRCIKN